MDLMPFQRKYLWLLIFFFFGGLSNVHGAIIYQDFEKDNGTPPSHNALAGSTAAEYGWGFNGAVVELNDDKERVHTGSYSWKITIPDGEHVHAGGAVPSQVQTYQVNFVPECHDRLTFWIWADPSAVGDNTAMVKFFDQGSYKQEGVGVWTKETARYRQWTQLTILFSQLPADFRLNRVDKIEFFNYWDGTYYYDDIEIHSAATAETDAGCLKKENYLSCLDPFSNTAPGQMQTVNPVLGLSAEETVGCRSVFTDQADGALDHLSARNQRRLESLALMEPHESH